MGLSIRYEGIIRTVDVERATQSVLEEAARQGFQVEATGDISTDPAIVGDRANDYVSRGLAVHNPNWATKPERGGIYWKGRGALIWPGEGSESFDLSFIPYSPEVKAHILRDGTEDFSFSSKSRMSKDAEVVRHAQLDIVQYRDSFEKKWRKGVDLTPLLDPESARPGFKYVMALVAKGMTRGEVPAYDVYSFDRKTGEKYGKKEVYRFFVPFHDPELMEQWQPGTAYLDGDTKTQYADEFMKVHSGVVRMLDVLKPHMQGLKVDDDGGFWETRDVDKLAEEVGAYNLMIGGLTQAIGEKGLTVESPAVVKATEGAKPISEKFRKDIGVRRPGGDVKVHKYRRGGSNGSGI